MLRGPSIAALVRAVLARGAFACGVLARAVLACGVACGALVGESLAQSSPNYTLQEQTFNAGGHPLQGSILASTHFQIARGSIGPAGAGESGSCWGGLAPREHCYELDGGLVAAYPAPGEVCNLAFGADGRTLQWTAERSAHHYNVYRDMLTALSGGAAGMCFMRFITSTSLMDEGHPPAADGFFYLVTADNALDEEGTKGWNSAGVERANPDPCP